jgi:hypothetical protein
VLVTIARRNVSTFLCDFFGRRAAIKVVVDGRVLTFRDGQSGTPLISKNVQADAAVAVDVGVVDAGGEVDLGRLEGVVCGEMDGEEEDTARVWGVALLDLLAELLLLLLLLL